MKLTLYNAFIAPFLSAERARLYIAAMLGCFGATGVSIFLTYDYATTSPDVLLAFMTAHVLFFGVFFLPLLLVMAANASHKIFFPCLVILQLLALINIPFADQYFAHPAVDAFMVGCNLALISAPFWMSYHVLMVQHTTDDNRGNEVSVSGLGMGIGSIVGALTSGVALYYEIVDVYVFICMLAMLLSTIVMMRLIPHDRTSFRKMNIYRSLVSRPRRSLNTIMNGCFDSLTGFLLPVWLKVIGLTGLGVGLFSALQFLLKIIISPFTGKLVKMNRGHESQLGAAINIAGWLPWLFTISPLGLIWSFLIRGPGQHMYNVGLQSRWYEERTYENMAAREVCLSIGRYLTILISLPLIYGDIKMFFIVAMALTCLKLLVSFFEARSLRPITAP
jgi:hypothetical protein